MNDILVKMNLQHVTLLVTLHLSAAFDTFNHKIWLERLQHDIGISRVPLQWFKSYSSNRNQRIAVQGTLSRLFEIDSGIPQASCLGPLLYVIYSSKLLNIIERHFPDMHCYADDSQLYLSFRPADGKMYREHTTQDGSNRLLLNDEKTEHLLIGTCQQLETKIHQIPHTICDSENINIFRIEKYFSQDAWFKVLKILQKK